MKLKEFINIINPEHDRLSCETSQENKYPNGFWYLEDGTIDRNNPPRCSRCAYLEIVSGDIQLNETNKKIIAEMKQSLSF